MPDADWPRDVTSSLDLLLVPAPRGLRRVACAASTYSASTSCPAFCALAWATIFACWCDGTSS